MPTTNNQTKLSQKSRFRADSTTSRVRLYIVQRDKGTDARFPGEPNRSPHNNHVLYIGAVSQNALADRYDTEYAYVDSVACWIRNERNVASRRFW